MLAVKAFGFGSIESIIRIEVSDNANFSPLSADETFFYFIYML